MHLRQTLLLLAFAVPAAFAQSGKDALSFDLTLNGKSFGKDTYTLAKAKSGYKVLSHLQGASKGAQIDFRDSFEFTDDYTYVTGAESNQDSAAQTSWTLSKDGRDMTLNSSGQGNVANHIEPMAGQNPLLVMPAFDAGAAQAAILYTVAHPETTLYTVWLPGYALSGIDARSGVSEQDNSGVDKTDALPPGAHSFNAQWIKGPAFSGTLDGKPVALRSYQMGFGRYRWSFFTDEQNNLMEVSVSVLHSSYIRSKFKLDVPKAAPPAP